jgi:diadenosine tetraphosphate (Ap4A) HIT family hydrolase
METVTGAEDMPEMVRGETARRKSRWQSDPMPETPEELYARTTASAGPDGRLPAPPVTEWPSFPWDASDGRVVPKPLAEPVEMEEPREGEVETRPCPVCTRGPEHVIWANERWTVSHRGRPTGLPVVLLLEPKDHLDYPDLNDTEAAEFGRVSARLCRVMSHLPNVGRVHVNRWGDGSEHLHVWFFARPARIPGVSGTYAVEWDAILPPVPEDVWRADLRTVATKLANYDGKALV